MRPHDDRPHAAAPVLQVGSMSVAFSFRSHGIQILEQYPVPDEQGETAHGAHGSDNGGCSQADVSQLSKRGDDLVASPCLPTT